MARCVARYDNGVKLILRENDWIPLGSCPVRFEGETGWVETGDSGKMVLSLPPRRRLLGYPVAEEVHLTGPLPNSTSRLPKQTGSSTSASNIFTGKIC